MLEQRERALYNLQSFIPSLTQLQRVDKASLVLCFRLDPVEKSLLLTVSSISQVNLTTTVLLTLTTLIKLLQTEEICLPTILIFVLFFVVA